MKNEIVRVSPKDVVLGTLDHLIYGASGLSQTDKDQAVQSLTRIYKNMRAGRFLSSLIEEWKMLEEKGKIPSNYQYTEEHNNCIGEILDYLDNGVPNDKIFEVLKKMFLVSVMDNTLKDTNVLPNQFIKVAKELSSGELIVLFSIFRLSKSIYNVELNQRYHHKLVFEKIAQQTGLNHSSLVKLNCERLIDKYLISSNFKTKQSEYVGHYLPTDFGIAFCEYVEKYDELTSS